MKKTYLKRVPMKRAPGALKRPLGAKKKRKMGKSMSKLKKELDAAFSRFIRQRDNHTCYTCGLVMEPKKSQNGHFIPRQYLAVRWDEVNNHAQCWACNCLYNGQPGAYAVRLEKDYGEGTVARLEARRKEITKLTPEWYVEKTAYYKQILENEQEETIPTPDSPEEKK